MMIKKNRRPLFGLGLILLMIAALAGCEYDGNAPEYIVDTIAGTAGVGGRDNGIRNAKFTNPQDVAVHGNNLYVADTSNHQIRKVDLSTGEVTLLAGNARGLSGELTGEAAVGGEGVALTDARFNNPRRLAINAAGTKLYVADHNNRAIREIDIHGLRQDEPDDRKVYTLMQGSGSAGPNPTDNFYPVDIALDKEEKNLYMSSIYGQTIIRLPLNSARNGEAVLFAGVNGKAGVADGSPLTAQFNEPNGLAVGSDGTVYVADFWGQCFRAIQKTYDDKGDESGWEVVVYGSPKSWSYKDGASGIAQVGQPLTLAIDDQDTLYFTDNQIPAIRKITKGSIIDGSSFDTPGYPEGSGIDRPDSRVVGRAYMTLAGHGAWNGEKGYKDGDGMEARFNLKGSANGGGLAVVDNGKVIYVADTGNHVIRRITRQ